LCLEAKRTILIVGIPPLSEVLPRQHIAAVQLDRMLCRGDAELDARLWRNNDCRRYTCRRWNQYTTVIVTAAISQLFIRPANITPQRLWVPEIKRCASHFCYFAGWYLHMIDR